MACRYYDDLVVAKLQKWIPEASKLRVLKPDETKRLFELTADDKQDKNITLPLIAVSRSNDIELLSTIKTPKSYDGLRIYNKEGSYISADLSNLKGEAYQKALAKLPAGVHLFNAIPIRLQYNLDIYTKKYEECDEYIRNFVFKLINNPSIKILIPYNDINIEHIAYIRLLSTVSDTSAISERIFSGQFTRFTIQFEIQDAFLFNIPYKENWRLYVGDEMSNGEEGFLEISNKITQSGELEKLDFKIIKK